MASASCFNLLSIISLVVICFCVITSCHGYYNNLHFLTTLNGTKRGDQANGLDTLRKYLARIGYTGHDGHLRPDADEGNEDSSYFDDKLELALKTYQEFYNLKPTGILDSPTIKQLNTPRCGVPDTPSQMLNSKNGTKINPQFAISGYFWPTRKRRLTYSYPKNMDELARPAIAMATGIWTDNTPFDINFVEDFHKADIKMTYKVRNRGPLPPFDGPGGIVAQATYPPDGRIQFDGDEKWVPIADDGMDMASVTLHELGHTLGLAHSNDPAAVMFAHLEPGQSKWVLTKDDLDGFKALYLTN